jgi:hypothetical protein
MTKYEKKVLHGCNVPVRVAPGDEQMELRWKCPDCGAEWWWAPKQTWHEDEWYGFMGMRCRAVERTIPGRWYTRDDKVRESWVEAS